jgi:uncharacterized protein YoxC
MTTQDENLKLLIQNTVFQQQERGNLDSKLYSLSGQIEDIEQEISAKQSKINAVEQEIQSKAGMINTMVESGNNLNSARESEANTRSRNASTLETMYEKQRKTAAMDVECEEDRRKSIESFRSIHFAHSEVMNRMFLVSGAGLMKGK